MGLTLQKPVTSAVQAAQPVQSGEDAATSEPSMLAPAGWILTADGKLGAASDTVMGTARLNGDAAEQAKAGQDFQRLIDRIINPGRDPDLHARCKSRGELLKYIATENGLHPSTLRRKLKRFEAEGVNGLIRKIRVDKGVSRTLSEAARRYIISACLPDDRSYGEFSIRGVFERCKEESLWRASHAGKQLRPDERAKYWMYINADGYLLPSAQLGPLPSYATFCRQVARIPQGVKTMARQGEKAYRNTEIISYRDFESIRPLDYVVMDHRVLDIMALIREPRGWRLGRPWITAALDMRTRKWLAWCIVERPSSDSIATVAKRVFLDFGLPRSFYFDRGKDFCCQWLEGRRKRRRSCGAIEDLPKQWTGVMDSLGIRITHALPYRARSKSIEPNFINIANFDRTLPEYCGHRPGPRPERFDKLLREHEAWLSGERGSTPFRTIEEIARLYTDFIEDLNEHKEHRGEGMRKQLPEGWGWYTANEIWDVLIPRIPRRSAPEAILRLCFAKRRDLTIRNGQAHATFEGKQYHYRLDSNRMGLLPLNGHKVELCYDPGDLGEAVIICDGEFIGLARCVELRRMAEDAFVQDERDRRAGRRELKKFIAAVHKAEPVADAETYLARRRAITPARPDVERPTATVGLPKAIADAHAAQEAERAFSFEAVIPVEVIKCPERPDDDGAFNFYQTKGD